MKQCNTSVKIVKIKSNAFRRTLAQLNVLTFVVLKKISLESIDLTSRFPHPRTNNSLLNIIFFNFDLNCFTLDCTLPLSIYS